MISGGTGGSHTTTGLKFEFETDLTNFFKNNPKYEVKDKFKHHLVLCDNKKIGLIFQKHGFYSDFLEPLKIDWEKRISKKLLPDDCIFVFPANSLYIIEKKFQSTQGSVDEKLQTCDFKIKQYRKLLEGTGISVNYVYLLNEWFRKKEYTDVRNYIKGIDGCDYFFDYIPLDLFGLYVLTSKTKDLKGFGMGTKIVEFEDKTHLDYNYFNDIRTLSQEYGPDNLFVYKLFSIFYLTMISEENRRGTKLGKRIKRLGVHYLLIEDQPLHYSINFMRGMKWKEIDELCKERGC